MRLFWELCKLSFQRQLAYRISNLAGLATNLFFGLLRAAILIALYQQREEVAGISLRDAVTFTALTQALIAYLQLFGINNNLMNSVHSGEVAADLLKPMNFYLFWFAKDYGGSVVSLFIRGVPIMAAYALFFPITYPIGISQWAGFIVALTLGWIVYFSFRFNVSLTAFWVTNADGISRLAYTISWFLCGFLMPLRFYPDWFVRLCAMTPFPSVVTTPVEIYLGVLTGTKMVQAILVQCLWGLALYLIGQMMLRAGVRRLVIQGG